MKTETDKKPIDEGLIQPRLVRPLPSTGVADCPSCRSKQTVTRHNADWTCYKCWYHEVVDDDKEVWQKLSDLHDKYAERYGEHPDEVILSEKDAQAIGKWTGDKLFYSSFKYSANSRFK